MRTGHCAHVGLCNKRVPGSCCGSHRLLSVPGVQRCAQWLWVCIVAMGVHSSGCAQWLRVYMVSVGVHSGGCTAQWVCTVAVGVHGSGHAQSGCAQWSVCIMGVHSGHGYAWCWWGVCAVSGGVHCGRCAQWCAQWLHFGRYAQCLGVHNGVSVGVHGACGCA